MSASFLRTKWEVLREIAFGDITSNFTIIGTPLDNNPRLVKIFNTTDSDVELSVNGIDPHIIQPARTGTIYDFATNRTNQSAQFEMSVGDAFYVREISGAPSSGSVFVEVIYASDH